MIFVIIAVAIFFAFFVIQSKKTPQVVEVAPSQEVVDGNITPANVDAETTTEELATVPMDTASETDAVEQNVDSQAASNDGAIVETKNNSTAQ